MRDVQLGGSDTSLDSSTVSRRESIAILNMGGVEQLGTADEFMTGPPRRCARFQTLGKAKRNMILHEGGCASLMWAFKIGR
jgi:hypothetical protein